jgi:phosphonate transport system substrate-binding protein
MIHRAGVSDKDLRRFEFLGSHDNVALGVLSGDFDAGAVKDEIFYKYQKQGLKELAATPEIPDHVFVARNSLPAALVKKIRSALFSMSGNLEGRRILSAIRNDVTGIVPVQDSDYQKLRLILNELAKSGIK